MSEEMLDMEAGTGRQPFAGVAAVSHAIAVLKALPANGAPIGVNELARRVGLHKSTVSRLLATLDRHDFVQRDPENGRVSLGIGLVALVSPLLGNLDVVTAAKPILNATAEETGESTSLALWSGSEAVLVEQSLGARAVVHYAWPGKILPAHTTAVGKILLAFQPADVIDRVIKAGLRRCTPFTITDPTALLADLGRARSRGYATNDQENELESCGIAAPVRSFRGMVVAGLTVAIPKYRFDAPQQQAITEAVVRAAEQVSRRLGWTGNGAAPRPGV